MNFRFHIIDRNDVSTETEEPVGFDALTCVIGRDANWHGIFFTNSGETFEFYDVARKLLLDEYNLYGAQGDMTLLMEEECAGVWTELDRGKFVFSSFEEYNDDCYVKCPLEAIGEVMDLRNRVDQKVDLESLTAFDETTVLTPYGKLAFDLQLPSKGIFMQDKAEFAVADDTTIQLPVAPNIQYNTDGAANYNYAWFQIVPQFDKQDLAEFGTFSTPVMPEHSYIKPGFYDQRKIKPYTDSNGNLITIDAVVQQTFPTQRWIYFDPSSLPPLLINDNFSNNFNAIKTFSLDIAYSFDIKLINANIAALYNVLVIAKADNTFEYLAISPIFNGVPGGGPAGFNSGSIWLAGSTNTVSFSSSQTAISLGNGDYLFTVVCGLSFYSNFDARDGLNAYTLTANSGSVNMQTLTHFAETNAKVFAVNEALSRISESITNDKLRAYSEYFGRTDSHPYAVAADGCGALEVITDGLRIRGLQDSTPGKILVFSLSLQDMFNGLCPVHNIGMGIETDTNRAGYNRLRVEPWSFFYNDTLIMSCTGIDNIVRKVNDKEIFSTFEFGYSTWEAQAYNGLDEFLTKRAYRTAISQVKNDFSKISTFIASGYALEVTRRQDKTTIDWQYDNNVFIVCIKRGGTQQFLIQFIASNTLKIVCLGNNYTAAEAVFYTGAVVAVTGVLNTGNFTVTATSEITNYLVVTVAETVLSETVTADVPAPNGLSVELGNVTSPVNIVDPDTLYNYRISPLRNAMRWMNKVLASYRQFNSDSKIIFTSGDGNYFAQGEMTDTNCRLEGAALIENKSIDPTVFADSLNAKPIMFPERVTFTYPFTANDYAAIKANPGGKIYFESARDSGYGWIDTITWNPKEGTATFNIIPKFTN